jgi:hypothetical protein
MRRITIASLYGVAVVGMFVLLDVVPRHPLMRTD